LSYFIRIHDAESDGWLHFYFSMHPLFWGASQGLKKVTIGTLYVCGAHANNGPHPHIKVSESHFMVCVPLAATWSVRLTLWVLLFYLSIQRLVSFLVGPCTNMRLWPCCFFGWGTSLYPHFESGPQRKKIVVDPLLGHVVPTIIFTDSPFIHLLVFGLGYVMSWDPPIQWQNGYWLLT